MAATRGVAPGCIEATPLALRDGVSWAVSFHLLRTSIWTVMAAEIKISRNCFRPDGQVVLKVREQSKKH
jgi:hypothetical protein